MTLQEALALVRVKPQEAAQRLLHLAMENEQLRGRVRELEGLLAKSQAQPTTPSGAIPPYQKPNRKKRKKKPGRKKGHPGAGRRTPDRIDAIVPHHISVCPRCNGAVKETGTPRKRVIEEVPREPSRATEHQIFHGWCPHCQKMVEPKITVALPKSMIALSNIVEAAWLHYVVGMSLSNLVKHFKHRGLRITAGGLTQAFVRLAQLLKPGYDQILDRVKASAVLHADETSWRISGLTHWLWYFGTSLWSYYVIDRHRGSEVVRRVLGSILSGILICDFWAAYSFLEALAKQRCMFHLFTELEKVDLRNHSPGWAWFRARLYRILRDAIQLAAANQKLDAGTYARRKALIHRRLDELIHWPLLDRDARRLVKRLKRHRAELFVFLDHPNTVSPYNNHAEQQMRTPVLTRRVSHGNRSATGAETQAILLSLFRSFELQHNNPIEAILRLAETALAGHPIVLQDPISPAAESTTAQTAPRSRNDAQAVPDTALDQPALLHPLSPPRRVPKSRRARPAPRSRPAAAATSPPPARPAHMAQGPPAHA